MSKFLNATGVQTLWSKVKALTSDKLTEDQVTGIVGSIIQELAGSAEGLATLGTDSKLTSTQLPSFKTINGSSVIGSGDITIDLSLYKIVESLPTTGIDSNKIYLVIGSDSNPNDNKYIEYIYVNSAWEKVGEYKATVDVSGAIEDALQTYVQTTDVVSETKNGVMTPTQKSKLDNIAANATADEAITTEELNAMLV